MKTLEQLSEKPTTIPTATSWYLADLGEARGRQELFILKMACREFEERVGQLKSPRGAKTELVESAVAAFDGTFTLADLERACPGVSRDMVRRVLRNLQHTGTVECLGRGPGAPWRRRGITPKRG